MKLLAWLKTKYITVYNFDFATMNIIGWLLLISCIIPLGFILMIVVELFPNQDQNQERPFSKVIGLFILLFTIG